MKNNVIKILVFGLIMLATNEAKSQVTFGLQGGITGATQVYKNEGVSNENVKFRTSFNLGVLADIPIADPWFFEPGLYYIGKGSRILSGVDILADALTGNGNIGESIRFNYAEVPLNILYKLPVADHGYLLGYGGPYVGYLISAKGVNDGSKDDFRENLKDLDAGLNVGAGVQINNIRLGLQFELGLMNVDKSDDGKIKNLDFSFSLAYMFGKN